VLYRLGRGVLESVWTHWGVDPTRPGHPGLVEAPPFTWGDRYDLIGIALGLPLVAVLAAVGVPFLLAVVFGCAVMNLTSYALRRRAGIPQVTLWQWWRHARR